MSITIQIPYTTFICNLHKWGITTIRNKIKIKRLKIKPSLFVGVMIILNNLMGLKYGLAVESMLWPQI